MGFKGAIRWRHVCELDAQMLMFSASAANITAIAS